MAAHPEHRKPAVGDLAIEGQGCHPRLDVGAKLPVGRVVRATVKALEAGFREVFRETGQRRRQITVAQRPAHGLLTLHAGRLHTTYITTRVPRCGTTSVLPGPLVQGASTPFAVHLSLHVLLMLRLCVCRGWGQLHRLLTSGLFENRYIFKGLLWGEKIGRGGKDSVLCGVQLESCFASAVGKH